MEGHHLKKTAILLVNLGTPDYYDTKSVRKYLKQFLGDKRVIDEPRWKWLPILHGVILRVRPKKSAQLYKTIWTEEGSPLLIHSNRQKDTLQSRFSSDNVRVSLAMTYGNPSIKSELKKLQQWGAEKFIILPMFPQYSSTTTAPVWDQVTTELQSWRAIPEVVFIRDFPNEKNFIKCLVEDIKNYIKDEGKPDALLLSYHGIPVKYAEDGDDYPKRCQLTTEAVEKYFPDLNIIQCYQSKFGNDPWLEPNTGDVLESLGKEGKQHVLIMAPAFTADCLETIEELEMEHKEIFLQSGGKKYHYLPAVNDNPLFIDSLETIVRKYL